MTHKEALTLALEAFKRIKAVDKYCDILSPSLDDAVGEAVTAIKEALAQPEQEPVAWELGEEVYWGDSPELSDYVRKEGTPLYTTPPQRKPLMDEMVLAGARALAKRHADSCGLDFDDVWKYYAEEHKIDAKAVIEAAHGIK